MILNHSEVNTWFNTFLRGPFRKYVKEFMQESLGNTEGLNFLVTDSSNQHCKQSNVMCEGLGSYWRGTAIFPGFEGCFEKTFSDGFFIFFLLSMLKHNIWIYQNVSAHIDNLGTLVCWLLLNHQLREWRADL